MLQQLKVLDAVSVLCRNRPHPEATVLLLSAVNLWEIFPVLKPPVFES